MRSVAFHVPNLMQMSENNRLFSFALDSAHVKRAYYPINLRYLLMQTWYEKMRVVFWIALVVRTVRTIVIAHTFCASRDTQISYCWCLLIQGYFCPVQNYAEKAELSKQVILVSKKKIRGHHAFLRDNWASIWKRTPYIALYLKLFTNIVD